MTTKEQRHRNFWAGIIIVGLTVVFVCIVLCAKEAAVIEVDSGTATASEQVATTPTAKIIYTDMVEPETRPATNPETELYMFPGTLDELEAQGGIFYPLTVADRAVIEQVVMAEAGSEPGAGIIALANCLYNAMLRCDGDLAAALIEYGYTDNRKTPTPEVSECVSAVFDRGELLLDDDVLYFCRSDCESALYGWHSEQELVCTIGNHNFYKEART